MDVLAIKNRFSKSIYHSRGSRKHISDVQLRWLCHANVCSQSLPTKLGPSGESHGPEKNQLYRRLTTCSRLPRPFLSLSPISLSTPHSFNSPSLSLFSYATSEMVMPYGTITACFIKIDGNSCHRQFVLRTDGDEIIIAGSH